MKNHKNTYFLANLTLISMILMSLLTACVKKQTVNKEETSVHNEPPVITVFFVPLDGISSASIENLKNDFLKNFGDKKSETYHAEILDHMPTPDSCYNDSHSRFRANKMIMTLKNKFSNDAKKRIKEQYPKNGAYHIIGVTNKDISTSVHGKADYGILGLSFLGHKHGDASVVSTCRLKRKKDLWKLAAHEFCHGFYGCHHCKNDDPNCLMADAKGGNPHFEIKESLCADCAKICIIK